MKIIIIAVVILAYLFTFRALHLAKIMDERAEKEYAREHSADEPIKKGADK